jgi:hypothetical protein
MSTIGQAAAEKGTITAIKESATGFVRDTVKGTVTLPSRIIEASASGDPELLGATLVEAVQAGQGLKAPLQKVTTATVRTTERVLATQQILMRERVSKRGIGGNTREVTGTITVQDAWTVAGLCVQKGATGCAVVGGLQNPSWSNLWNNVRAKGTLARGEMLMNDAGKGYKYQGDVDFIQMRKDAPTMKNARLAAEVNARTSAQLLDQFPEHGVLGEFLPPEIVPLEVQTAWWAQEKLAPGSPIRAYDYWKKGVVLPDNVTLFDGKGKKVSGPFPAAYLVKPGKPGVTRRRLEKHAFEITNVVHVLDEAPKFASRPDMLLRFTLNTGRNQDELEKRQSK